MVGGSTRNLWAEDVRSLMGLALVTLNIIPHEYEQAGALKKSLCKCDIVR